MKAYLYSLCALALALSHLSFGAPQLPAVAPQTNSKQPIIGKYLNPGGDFYLFLDSGEWAEKFKLMVAKFEATAEAMVPEDGQEGLAVASHFVHAFLRDSGAQDVGGFGASSVKLAADLHHNRLFIQYPAGGPEGFLWEAFTAENRPLAFTQRLPANTALARWGVIRPQPVWEWVKSTIKASGNAEVSDAFQEAMADLEQDGIELERCLASLTGGIGAVITYDPKRMVKLPIDRDATVEIPAFAGALVVEVKDDTLFELIGKKLAEQKQEFERVEKNGVRALLFPEEVIDDTDLSFQVTIARFENFLVLSSSDQLVETLAAKTGGLVTTPHFRRCQQAMPQAGFAFLYLDPVATRTAYDAMMAIVAVEEPAMAKIVAAAYSPLRGMASWSVTLHTPDGVAVVANQSAGIAQFLITHTPTAHLPLLAGMMLPALVGAREKAQQISDMSNLKQIGLGVIMWSDDNGEKFPDDLGAALEYVGAGQVFVCPASKTVPPATAEEIRAGRCDYLYFGKGKLLKDMARPSSFPLACTKPGLLKKGHINVLYGDGHVAGHEQVPENVKKLIEATGRK